MQVSIGNTEIFRRISESFQLKINEIIDNHPNRYSSKETLFTERMIHNIGQCSAYKQMIEASGRRLRIKIEILDEFNKPLELDPNSPQT